CRTPTKTQPSPTQLAACKTHQRLSYVGGGAGGGVGGGGGDGGSSGCSCGGGWAGFCFGSTHLLQYVCCNVIGAFVWPNNSGAYFFGAIVLGQYIWLDILR
ncbi:unnamed protein product, partial [Laminaria digitata]